MRNSAIFYYCHQCSAVQRSGATFCAQCYAVFPRPVPAEKPLIVVVDSETRNYVVHDGEGYIDMSRVPPPRVQRAVHRMNHQMSKPQPKVMPFKNDPSATPLTIFGIICALILVGMLTSPIWYPSFMQWQNSL